MDLLEEDLFGNIKLDGLLVLVGWGTGVVKYSYKTLGVKPYVDF